MALFDDLALCGETALTFGESRATLEDFAELALCCSSPSFSEAEGSCWKWRYLMIWRCVVKLR